MRQVDFLPVELEHLPPARVKLPAEQSFLRVDGEVVVTSVQQSDGKLLVRLFNPGERGAAAKVSTPAPLTSVRSVTLEGKDDSTSGVKLAKGAAEVSLPPKRITTLILE